MARVFLFLLMKSSSFQSELDQLDLESTKMLKDHITLLKIDRGSIVKKKSKLDLKHQKWTISKSVTLKNLTQVFVK